ncbi:glycosyl hydrolase [Bacteroidia bacterium]|nr:glycosyl hydrolase [Bacteroidia bacterium]
MEKQNLVSVCIPCYNAAKFIGETLRSVLEQTYFNLEIIVHDDNSTDNTTAIVRSFDDPRIKLYVEEHRLGMSDGWNKMLSYATGKYMKVIMSDDIITRDCIEKQVAVFENYPRAQLPAVVVCRRDVISPSGEHVFTRALHLNVGENDAQKVVKKCLFWGMNVVGEPHLGLFRTETVKGVQFHATNTYVIDLDFYLKLLKKGSLYVQKEILASFRISSGALSTKLRKSQATMFGDLMEELYQDKYWHIHRFWVIWAKLVAHLLQIAKNIIYRSKRWK